MLKSCLGKWHPSLAELSVGKSLAITGGIIRRGIEIGQCPICEKRTLFIKTGDWLRDHYRCIRCLSIPRWRAVFHVLRTYFPNWRDLYIHESSPSGPTFRRLKAECTNHRPTRFFPNVPRGEVHEEVRCEDLAKQTFGDASFDLVITQDVLEHVLEPLLVFSEIRRTLKPGGAHVFTVPWYYWQETVIRARRSGAEIEYLEDPEYHGNPWDRNGSLVVTEWGKDLCDVIYETCGMTTTAIRVTDKRFGIQGEFNDVFISRRPNHEIGSVLARWDRM